MKLMTMNTSYKVVQQRNTFCPSGTAVIMGGNADSSGRSDEQTKVQYDGISALLTAAASLTTSAGGATEAGDEARKEKQYDARATSSVREDETTGEATKVEDLTGMMSNVLKIKDETRETYLDYFVKHASSASSQSFANSVDKVWSNELNEPQIEKKSIKETPELIARALFQMENEINSEKIPVEENQAHIRALKLHNHYCRQFPQYNKCCYVYTPYFRLRFLRAEQYDPLKAAIRYCRCLNVLHKNFGDNSLYL